MKQKRKCKKFYICFTFYSFCFSSMMLHLQEQMLLHRSLPLICGGFVLQWIMLPSFILFFFTLSLPSDDEHSSASSSSQSVCIWVFIIIWLCNISACFASSCFSPATEVIRHAAFSSFLKFILISWRTIYVSSSSSISS